MPGMYSYFGHCRSQLDCLILFEAACLGLIPRVSQRLSEDERLQIQSGTIYIWDEEEAGIKRWTDGKSWSTSRVSGPFLTYRELETVPVSQESNGCRIKPYGLCKQSASITVGSNTKLHLIAYFSKEDVRVGNLLQPSMDLRFKEITAFVKKENVGILPNGAGLAGNATTPPPMSPPMQSSLSGHHMVHGGMTFVHQTDSSHIVQPIPISPPHHTHPMWPVTLSPPVSGPDMQNMAIFPPNSKIFSVGQPMSVLNNNSPPQNAAASRPQVSHPLNGLQQAPPQMPSPSSGRPTPLPMMAENPMPQRPISPITATRAFDEDRRQLSLLDKSLFAY